VLCTVAAGGTNHISEVADVDYAYLLALGGGISVVSMTCLSAAAKYISATEVGIYLLGGNKNIYKKYSITTAKFCFCILIV
jgi:hypothetical protein